MSFSALILCKMGFSNTPKTINPRPDTVFRHLRSDRGGGGATPLGVSKRSVVELSGKDQHIALDEYSRLVVLFLGPRSIFDPVVAGQRSNLRKFYDFSTIRVRISKTIYRSGMGHSPACSPFSSAQNEVF